MAVVREMALPGEIIKTGAPDEVIELRTRMGLSQKEFAARAGTHYTTINRIENGKTKPSPLVLLALIRLDQEFARVA